MAALRAVACLAAKKGPPRMERMAPRPWRVALGSVVASVPDAKIRINGRTVPVTNSALRRRQMAMNPRERPARARVVCPTRNSAPIFFSSSSSTFLQTKNKKQKTKVQLMISTTSATQQQQSKVGSDFWPTFSLCKWPNQANCTFNCKISFHSMLIYNILKISNSLMTGETSVKKIQWFRHNRPPSRLLQRRYFRC